MIRLEDLKPGMRVCGLVPDQVVEIITAKGLGEAGSDTYRVIVRYEDEYDDSDKQTLDRSVEERLIEAMDIWAIGSEAELALLAAEAKRIQIAHLLDPFHSAFSAQIEPLPHQIDAVFGWMLSRYPLRVLLADDPGAGKTIMAGLLIRQLIARDVVRRCLIVVPGNLAEQWQSELREKLLLVFPIVTLDDIKNENPFESRRQLIVSMDRAKKDEYIDLIRQTEWDLIICDEAHKMSVSVTGSKVSNVTKRYRLGETLRHITTNYLLITATPHTGKRDEFRYFMRLLDEDRFAGESVNFDVSDIYLRRMKEQLVTRELTPLFPKRVSYTAKYDLSPPELDLYESVTKYCREEFNRAERWKKGGRRNTVGFALTILQRRLASSPEAIFQTLRSRKQRLSEQLHQSRADLHQSLNDIDLDEFEDLPADEREDLEVEIANLATAAQNATELAKEIETLAGLENQADVVRRSNQDSKWEELRDIWENRLPEMEKDGNPRKLIIFTEHRATLRYLVTKLGALLGKDSAVVTIHGGIHPKERRKTQSVFRDNPKVQILVATDAAGEGINLQFAHLMVNYDLPWNPNRLEQRFGRIHRIGQKEVCHLFNLVIGNTREDRVYRILAEKLETIGNALGGLVYDILGELFYETPLHLLVKETLQFGDNEERQREIERKVDSVFDLDRIKQLEERRLADRAAFDANRVLEDMEEYRAGHIQAHDTRDFIVGVFKYISRNFGSRLADLRERNNQTFEIVKVPGVISEFAESNGSDQVKDSYRSVSFDPDIVLRSSGALGAELISSEHPLLKAAIGWTLSHWKTSSANCGDAFPVLVDERTELRTVRMVCSVEWTIQNAFQRDRGNKESLTQEALYIEIDNQLNFRVIGPAPDLDFRPAQANELTTLHSFLDEEWTSLVISENVIQYHVNEELVAPRLRKAKDREHRRIELERREVLDSLNSQIAHEYIQADYFRRLAYNNPDIDTYRASESRHEQRKTRFEARKIHRERRWKLEEQITPSGVTVHRVAIIVPSSLLHGK